MLDNKHDLDEVAGNWYILVFGLPGIKSPLNLVSGITLRPINDSLSVFDLAAAGAVGFKEWALLEPIANGCTCEIETALDASIIPGYDTLNRAWLISALLVLRGFTKHLCVACSRYSWQLIAGHQKRHSHKFHKQLKQEGLDAAVFKPIDDLSKFKGGLLDYHIKLLTAGQTRIEEINSDDIEWINKYYETFNKLAAESESFRFALEAAIDWRFSSEPRAAISRLWGGIECIFGIKLELVYRISILSASLLCPRGNQRKEKYLEIKNLYGLRSKAVHGGQISKEMRLEALYKSYILLRDLLLLIIEKGHMIDEKDFDKALFE